MDLTQVKLTRAEWNNIEIPVSDTEKQVMDLILKGYYDINLKTNKTQSLYSLTKIEQTPENEVFLYRKYFEPVIQQIIRKYTTSESPFWGFDPVPLGTSSSSSGKNLKKMKSIDLLRIQNLETNIERNRDTVFEFLLIDYCKNTCKYLGREKTQYSFYLYTLIQIKKSTIAAINAHVLQFVNLVITTVESTVRLQDVIQNAYAFIEKNPSLLKYEDMHLYDHQKELFTVCKDPAPKLVLYVAPTGTGKTLSPIGLAQEYRVIFVCVARHIGLALAKSAISMGQEIAIGFGCETADDIRLHYYAAVDYTKDWRSGGIRKVDNSNGSKVRLMICDVKSYLTAMNYMLAFNPEERVITFWDEPIMTMDYAEHELHEVIHRNWTENRISKLVLSCATLPREDEIIDTVMDFKSRFMGARVHNIQSYDCRKSIPILLKSGICALPHLLYDQTQYDELQRCVLHCNLNKTMLRYFDLSEIVRFVTYVMDAHIDCIPAQYRIEHSFETISEITMNSLKVYYLQLLSAIPADIWPAMSVYMRLNTRSKFQDPTLDGAATSAGCGLGLKKAVSLDSAVANTNPATAGILATTKDAHTLTDGPTIFLCEEIKKIGNFYIQQSSIPAIEFDKIMAKILHNSTLSEKIARLEKQMEDISGKTEGGEKIGGGDSSGEKTRMCNRKTDIDKGSRGGKGASKTSAETSETFALLHIKRQELDALRRSIKYIALDPEYVPNTKTHQEKWTARITENAFVPRIDESVVKEIMSLQIENYLKILLLLGIGLFFKEANPRYLEIIKQLADEQYLFMIIASSDYIYGTNYQFCNGFIGKDLTCMTQQKTIQAMGRIGRNNIQQSYSIRFRDDAMVERLFRKIPIAENLEVTNMTRLFCS
jgi:hypothetical protein